MSANDGYLKHEITVWAYRMGRSYAAVSPSAHVHPFFAVKMAMHSCQFTVNNTSFVLHIN
jgi:hypothetical protein